LQTAEKIVIANMQLQSNISLKVVDIQLQKWFLQVAVLRWRHKKKYVRALLRGMDMRIGMIMEVRMDRWTWSVIGSIH
jgi:hypothetical protein